jgi:hypothetical protein
MGRIDTLLVTMTIVEKIGQLNMVASSRVVTGGPAGSQTCMKGFERTGDDLAAGVIGAGLLALP